MFNLLLRGQDIAGIMGGWSNEIHHTIGPIFMVLDVFFGSARARQGYRSALLVLVVPMTWVTFTMLRAPFVPSSETGLPPWYPYSFLDPGLMPGGNLGVVSSVALLFVAFVAIAKLQMRTIRSMV